MNKFKASDGLEIAYTVDDYSDPWRPADTAILVHAAMGSSIRFYAWVPELARDVAELADHLGAQRFHVAGSSAGSNVAAKTAIDYPDRVLSLGAFACTGGIRHGLQ